jgi:hypothetical protein
MLQDGGRALLGMGRKNTAPLSTPPARKRPTRKMHPSHEGANLSRNAQYWLCRYMPEKDAGEVLAHGSLDEMRGKMADHKKHQPQRMFYILDHNRAYVEGELPGRGLEPVPLSSNGHGS